MKNVANICIFYVMLLMALPLSAQETLKDADNISTDADKNQHRQYDNAEGYYNRGYYDKAESILKHEVKQLKGLYKTNAYRILALCAIEKGRYDDAREYVSMLLKHDPYYNPTLMDPQRLIDLINEAKSQSSGITTASRQAESVEEAPVPVTLITEDMIRFSGASTLQELLCLYVPGMSNIEGMESNIAMHGIYGLSQDKILFLQDGHRLNGSSTNAEAPDYRNSLDKIQQIEVLRGPASSLYGNVALTAVVNIITRKGAVLNGGRISGIAGTQNTYGGNFVVGGGNNVVDVTGWGAINSTNGFRHVINNVLGGTTTLYSNAYNKRPSYDVGIRARWGDFTMTVNSQRSKKTPYINVLQLSGTQSVAYSKELAEQMPQTMGYYIYPQTDDYNVVQNYNYSKYPMISSNGPGITRTNHHINLDYSHSFGNIDLQASGYISMEHTSLYNVMGDSIDFNIGYLLLNRLMLNTGFSFGNINSSMLSTLVGMYVKTNDVFQVLEWENISFGGQAQMLTKYDFLGHGTAIVGAQYDHFALTNGNLFIGGNASAEQMTATGKIFSDGMEDVLSGYAQLKHYFGNNLILNAGLRYDHKSRFNSDRLNRFSPRLSVIYKFSDDLSGRACYNYSFVDAPYIYRACQISMFGGGEDMKPEAMNSYQLGFTYHRPGTPFTAEINGFYNYLDNLITQNMAMANGYLFINAGRVRQTGVDCSAQYTGNRFFVNADGTWQRVLSSSDYNVCHGNRLGIPAVNGHIVIAGAPYVGKGKGFLTGGKLWLNVNSTLQSKTYYQTVDVLNSYYSMDFHGIVSKVPARIIVGAGATYEWKHLEINLTAKNLTNDQYMVGSVLSDGIPYSGRQILGKVTFKF